MRTNVNIVPVDHPKLSGNVEPCACFAIPHDELKRGVILYLHGGGYTCGDLEYAKGFGSVLASECGIRVLCLAYRLAPENPFPAALDDAVEAYRYLLSLGYLSARSCLRRERRRRTLLFALFKASPVGLAAALQHHCNFAVDRPYPKRRVVYI